MPFHTSVAVPLIMVVPFDDITVPLEVIVVPLEYTEVPLVYTVVPLAYVVDEEEFATVGRLVFKAIVRTKDVVRGAAPEDVGVIVVKMVVISCEAVELPVEEAGRDVAVLLDTVEFCEIVDDCADASRAADSHDRMYPNRIGAP